MEKKAGFFRNVVANLVMALVLIFTAVYVYLDDSTAVFSEDPIYKGSSPTNVSLMINVYWGTEYIDELLRIFQENDMVTTFFVGGTWAAEHNEKLKQIYAAGHEVGNHGYFHKDHKKLGAERNREEIEVTHKLVKSILGYDMNLFAPPNGSFSQATLEGAKELGYTTILWSKDTEDWRDHDTEQIYMRAVKDLKGGDLILMHPTKETMLALDSILKTIHDKGLKVTPVSAVIHAEGSW